MVSYYYLPIPSLIHQCQVERWIWQHFAIRSNYFLEKCSECVVSKSCEGSLCHSLFVPSTYYFRNSNPLTFGEGSHTNFAQHCLENLVFTSPKNLDLGVLLNNSYNIKGSLQSHPNHVSIIFAPFNSANLWIKTSSQVQSKVCRANAKSSVI